METLITILIATVLGDSIDFTNSLLTDLVPMSLHAELYMDSLLGTNILNTVSDILFQFGVTLIVLKFLKRGFDQYVLWSDGDPDAEPVMLLTGFVKALAIAISFPTMYNWLAEIIEDMTAELLVAVNDGMAVDFSIIITGISSAGLFTVILTVIFFIMYFMIYVQFLKRGLEIFILRVGVPLSCVGVMDSNGGVFRTYVQKFFQATLTVMVQLVITKMAVALMLNLHIFWGIAGLSMALGAPKFLSEFMIMSGGGNGAMNTVYQSARMAQLVKNVVIKK